MAFLEEENATLKDQLRQAQELIAKLREENEELKSNIDQSPTKKQ